MEEVETKSSWVKIARQEVAVRPVGCHSNPNLRFPPLQVDKIDFPCEDTKPKTFV